MCFQKFGKGEAADPQALNARWTGGSPGYVDGCLGWAGLPPATYADVVLASQGYGVAAAQRVSPNQGAIIGVDASATLGSPTHYLAFDHVEGEAVICGDPWVGDLCDVLRRYGNVTTVDTYNGPTGGGEDLTPEERQQLAEVHAWCAGTGNDIHGLTKASYDFQAGTGNATYANTQELVDALHSLEGRVGALEEVQRGESGGGTDGG